MATKGQGQTMVVKVGGGWRSQRAEEHLGEKKSTLINYDSLNFGNFLHYENRKLGFLKSEKCSLQIRK